MDTIHDTNVVQHQCISRQLPLRQSTRKGGRINQCTHQKVRQTVKKIQQQGNGQRARTSKTYRGLKLGLRAQGQKGHDRIHIFRDSGKDSG